MRFFLPLVLLALAALARGAEPVTVAVDPAPRQAFGGLGAGLNNWGLEYAQLTEAERGELSKLVFGELRMTSVRLWVNLADYDADRPRTLGDFLDRYDRSRLVADARQHGVRRVLLAPDGAPPRMKDRRAGGIGGELDFQLRDDALPAYADLLADFVKALRDEGFAVDLTGVQNEPNDLDRFAPEQLVTTVKLLRAALDARGLQGVGIVATEHANVDDVFYETMTKLRANPDAWRATAGVAHHAYSMGATPRAAELAAGAPEWWMTEASANGPERPGDRARAASLAARFLGDVNHGVTHWQHFIAFEVPDPRDDATRIVAYTTRPLRTTVFHKYHAYHALARAFDVGATFRRCASDLDGAMAWTYGRKPGVAAAVARNPDGTWAAAVANYTAAEFADQEQEGRAAATFDVTVALPAEVGDAEFAVTRVGAATTSETARAAGGRLTLRAVGPLDVVTARSAR